MKHKIKLFVGIFGVAFIILMFFGLVAYHAAINTSSERESNLLNTFLDYFVIDLIEDTKDSKGKVSQEAINHWLDRYEQISFGMAIFTKEDNIISILGSRNYSRYFITKLVQNDGAGHRDIESESYSWSSRQIDDTPFHVVVIHKVNKESNSSFFNSLGVPLIITMMLLLWVTTWLTIYLTSLYDRLNTQKNKLEFQAQRDSLTKLINRSRFLECLSNNYQEAKKKNIALSLCYININNFKDVNRSLGREYADRLLIIIGNRCKVTIGDLGYVARLGAAEFCILLSDTNVDEARTITSKVLKVLEEDIKINNIKLSVGLSSGIASYPQHTTTVNDLMQRAEIAMCSAKKLGSRITIFHDDLLENYNPDLSLISLNPEQRRAG